MQQVPGTPGGHHAVDPGDALARTRPLPTAPRRSHTSAAETIVEHVRELLERGALRPGDRLPPERSLALQTGVSRSSVRVGLRALATMGIIQSRHGSGTYIADGPPMLESDSLHFLAALHGFTRDEMFEARRLIEVSVAGLAATRATGEQVAAMAEEVTSMFASLDDAQAFLRHDIRFHQAVAAACGNPILTSLVEMLSQVFYERRRETVERARNFRDNAEMHRRIYMAIRHRDPVAAREAMTQHLTASDEAQALEEVHAS
ncbi:FadR/GntR family transcriptional regulator [Luteitalea sp.]|jgi:GntR family transcriptional repressor for pyruvate dehydrogenase complex|uniref:FadR/GntR family transcriptional regulator n=1 Tax=Luteitalea sp. TaxID=2004800 RepID=UPI0037C7D4B6